MAGWKVLRLLGNLCDLEGFDYTHTNEILADIPEVAMKHKLDLDELAFELQHQDCETYCVPILPLYATDPIVRRSPSLQAAHDAPKVVAQVSQLDSDEVMVFQEGVEVTLAAEVADKGIEGVLLIDKGLISTAGLHSGCVTVKPV